MMKLIAFGLIFGALVGIGYNTKETRDNTAAILHILNVAASK